MTDLERFNILVNRLEALTNNIAALVGLVIGYQGLKIRPPLRIVQPPKDEK